VNVPAVAVKALLYAVVTRRVNLIASVVIMLRPSWRNSVQSVVSSSMFHSICTVNSSNVDCCYNTRLSCSRLPDKVVKCLGCLYVCLQSGRIFFAFFVVGRHLDTSC